MKVSVVLPVYNCAGNLRPLFEEFLAKKPDHIDLELIWINDASTDGGMDEVYDLESDQIESQLINLPVNMGSYCAVVEGLEFCTGDAIVVMAADGQDPPSIAFDLVTYLGEFDLVSASKNQPSSGFANWLFHKMMKAKVGANATQNSFEMVAFKAQNNSAIIEDPASKLHLFYFLDRKFSSKKVINYDKRTRAKGKSGWTFFKKASLFVQCWRFF